jgi:endonuclease/exonuclease/phosphatase family metal-dependent hydrolase
MLTMLRPMEVFTEAFPTRLGRSLLAAKFRIHGQVIVAATNHLESYPQDRPYREKQLRVAEETLRSQDNDAAVLMGDFNFATEAEREELVTQLDYLDVWSSVHPDEPGFTYDPVSNIMLKEQLSTKGRNDDAHRY